VDQDFAGSSANEEELTTEAQRTQRKKPEKENRLMNNIGPIVSNPVFSVFSVTLW
jgi:hypothetical protein